MHPGRMTAIFPSHQEYNHFGVSISSGGGESPDLWVVNLIFSESTPISAPFVVYIGDLIRTLILTKEFEGGLQDS